MHNVARVQGVENWPEGRADAIREDDLRRCKGRKKACLIYTALPKSARHAFSPHTLSENPFLTGDETLSLIHPLPQGGVED